MNDNCGYKFEVECSREIGLSPEYPVGDGVFLLRQWPCREGDWRRACLVMTEEDLRATVTDSLE
jgi:hypothetical protein